MAEDRPITPEQALLAVKAAALDTDKSLSEQLNASGGLSEDQVKSWVREALAETLGAQPKEKSSSRSDWGGTTDPQPRERTFAEGYAKALDKSRSKWFGDDP